jgi:biotin carboxylase
MPRVLLLLPTTTYRAPDFLAAAERLHIDVVAASEKPNVMASQHPDSLLTLDFRNLDSAVQTVRDYHKSYPIDGVIPVDDDTAVLAAAIGSALGLKHNSVRSAMAAGNKAFLVELLRRDGLPVPESRLYSTAAPPEILAQETAFPCVLKPVFLSASRGVIRADDPSSFVEAWNRILAILAQPEVAARGGDSAKQILVQAFVPGIEFALEGLLTRGELQVLALFDKPDPLDGPFFEETIYTTPSRHPALLQKVLAQCVSQAACAIGLREGPIHAELRWNKTGLFIMELAARSIGGLCSRSLRFGAGISLEELILRHALDLPLQDIKREQKAGGVMMIPIPKKGELIEIHGLESAKSVPGIEDVVISARPGNPVVPLPEGASYLGFIFSRGETACDVESALREAHRRLDFIIE